MQENEVQWQDDLVVHYTSDTEPGSSGASVCNNNWQLVALHHASKPSNVPGFSVLNEGIKLSAIAADLERLRRPARRRRPPPGAPGALRGTDERLGFFGTLGPADGRPESGLEAVVNTFQGTEQDIDVGFWNVEWLTKHYETKAAAVADVIHEVNLDVWSLEESSPNAAERGRQGAEGHLRAGLRPRRRRARSAGRQAELHAPLEHRHGRRPARGRGASRSRPGCGPGARDFDDLGLGGFEAVHGKIFDRYPALFKVTTQAAAAGGAPFEFYLVPVHLKAMAEGSLRRQMASKILAEAVRKKIEDGAAADWVVGGDFNAELDTGDFAQPGRRRDGARQRRGRSRAGRSPTSRGRSR